ncbi:MBL fold metallo-hydrolase [Actinoplanes sichuanensis]|uniref:MBL fold metallo-hydrolase n=1 Tax=Actinoplanes sichuanensis TaxID=512349 RepID=A0ABW4A677_9ACTN|nr:MBL fold metallo-hydrolase [Actinoplanes sichuanensis]BEL05197.1 MBL fold metallo-hydrolase [Actinoplanes sichuanensis]
MRIRLGRPDLGVHAGRFDVPAAAGAFGVTFFGVSGLLFADGTDAVMTDGFFSRPSPARVGLGRIAPDERRIATGLERLGPHAAPLRAVMAVHTHFDHVLDSPTVARRTGAALVGGESAANVGRGAGLPEDRIHVVTPGSPRRYGTFAVTFVESEHCPPDRFPGVIGAPLRPPVRAAAYRCGEAWSILVGHDSGRTALVQGSAGFVPGALDGRSAEVVFLGVGGLGASGEAYIREYWLHTVRAVGARRVVLIHWDDFFRPLDRPLRALPYAADDLDLSIRVLGDLAGRDRIGLHLPSLWRREDPWEAACGSNRRST